MSISLLPCLVRYLLFVGHFKSFEFILDEHSSEHLDQLLQGEGVVAAVVVVVDATVVFVAGLSWCLSFITVKYTTIPTIDNTNRHPTRIEQTILVDFDPLVCAGSIVTAVLFVFSYLT